MPVSNKMKGYISLAQTLIIALGAQQMFTEPNSYIGLGIMIVAAVIGAVKHWADNQDSKIATPDPLANQSTTGV